VVHRQSGLALRIQRIAEIKDDEFEGDEQAQTPLKDMLPPFLDGM
jgi:hypothetical protein